MAARPSADLMGQLRGPSGSGVEEWPSEGTGSSTPVKRESRTGKSGRTRSLDGAPAHGTDRDGILTAHVAGVRPHLAARAARGTGVVLLKDLPADR